MTAPRRTTDLQLAAQLLARSRKTLQRWRKLDGAPFTEAGKVNVDELREWATARGLLERGVGQPPVAERLLEGAGGAPPPAAASAPDKPARVDPRAALAQLNDEERAALADLERAFGAGVAGAPRLLDLAASVDPGLISRLASLARVAREQAEATRLQLGNAKAREELVEIADVRRFWTGQIELVKARFQALPGKLARELASRTYDEVHGILERELGDLLRAFATDYAPGRS